MTSNLRGGVALLIDWLALIVLISVGISINHWLVTLILLWPIGLFQFSIGEVLAHEASHYNLFRNRRWNNWAEWLCTLPFFFSISDYRDEHLKHHTKLGSHEDHLVGDYRRRGLFRIPPRLIWIWFGKPLIGIAGIVHLKSVLFELLSARAALKISVLWSPILLVCFYTETLNWLLWFWILPLFWSYSSFLWWSEIRDHFGTKTGTRTDISWMNLVTHNNGYHYAHHKYPSIPWHRIREAHDSLCKNENLDISTGFIDAFRQMLPPDEPTITRGKDSMSSSQR
jgi:fatty acid desaturase